MYAKPNAATSWSELEKIPILPKKFEFSRSSRKSAQVIPIFLDHSDNHISQWHTHLAAEIEEELVADLVAAFRVEGTVEDEEGLEIGEVEAVDEAVVTEVVVVSNVIWLQMSAPCRYRAHTLLFSASLEAMSGSNY